MIGAGFLNTRGRRLALTSIIVAIILVVALSSPQSYITSRRFGKHKDRVETLHTETPHTETPDQPKYLDESEWNPPPIQDPFPSLATSPPPPIPAWNVAKQDLHKNYGLSYRPPLFIGFTRGWPLLLQAVVSYITAGWPAEQIYVVENTGTQWANAQGKLSLQNPFYLSHEVLKEKLHVNVVQTPVLLNFAQLQNFYVHLAHESHWPQYFWSHMDVLVLSWEDGHEDRPRPGDEDYKTLYEYALAELNTTLRSNDRWATRFFAYDTLTLVNRAAYDDVGGWDTYIPYYMTDCDMHSRLLMRNWTLDDRLAGIISDVSTTLKDLRVLYRDPAAEMGFMDPNPAAPEKLNETHEEVRTTAAAITNPLSRAAENEDEGALSSDTWTSRLKYWQTLRETVAEMERYKHGSRGRNTWQAGQRGGQGEPYYYPARGVQMSFEMLTEAGRRIYAEKWGHRDCDLLREGGPKVEDQWRVAHDWE
ncbi:hypothetical protein E4U49_006690 [Claviceps purpurea]|nr:hypothetical protein E4U49_006690 [Claviceps purpurea]